MADNNSHRKDQWIGIMADRLDSERLRGFCNRQTDRWTDRQMDICNSKVAFATEKKKQRKFCLCYSSVISW